MSKVEKNYKTYDSARFRKLLHAKLNSSKSQQVDDGEYSLRKDNSDLVIYLLYLSFINDVLKEARKKSIGPGNEGEITEQRVEKAESEVMDRYKM
ncbi:hypothetical protein KGF57_002356 [Candida theae]|uniref:Uncharacterized protein n=1 Tax=Candida theae TaxID=1198502 RepID=A0AAD5BFG3_9ASCO|nr:uncharacterized protein KGF57_002356 [Candida theae]KAI5958922.1 hypothetical protein KGF57_002356 [Candida theae]